MIVVSILFAKVQKLLGISGMIASPFYIYWLNEIPPDSQQMTFGRYVKPVRAYSSLSFLHICRDADCYVVLDIKVVKRIVILVKAGSTERARSTFWGYSRGRSYDNTSFEVNLCVCSVRHFLKILDFHIEDAAAQVFFR